MAYDYLDVDPQASDEYIIGKYRSRLADTGPSMHAQIKSMLEKLGRARMSQALRDAASDSECAELCECDGVLY